MATPSIPLSAVAWLLLHQSLRPLVLCRILLLRPLSSTSRLARVAVLSSQIPVLSLVPPLHPSPGPQARPRAPARRRPVAGLRVRRASSARLPCLPTTTRSSRPPLAAALLPPEPSAKAGARRRALGGPSRHPGGRLVRLPDSPHAPQGQLARSVRTCGARRTPSRGTRIRPLQDSLGALSEPTTRPLHLIPVVDA